MNAKRQEKNVKRQTAERRAQRQTARRRKQLETDRSKEQRAQDMYETGRAAGEVARNPKKMEYPLRGYSYNMFEYGNPYSLKLKSSSTTPMNKLQKKAKRHAVGKAQANQTIKSCPPVKRRNAKKDRGQGQRTHTSPQRRVQTGQ